MLAGAEGEDSVYSPTLFSSGSLLCLDQWLGRQEAETS